MNIKNIMLAERSPKSHVLHESISIIYQERVTLQEQDADWQLSGTDRGGMGINCLTGMDWGFLEMPEMVWNQVEVVFAQSCECAK